jgi:outer membrane receptor protein involved in Fe transport
MKKIFIVIFSILLIAGFFPDYSYAGKTVYPVDDFGLESGSIYDVLRLIPMVQVADDGTISIRGNTATQVMIDHRPASPGGDYQAVVQQLTIEMVKAVEVITTPSARYDAEAGGGIVNFVLTGESLEGRSGSVSAKAATGDKYNLDGSLGVHKGKWSGRLNLTGQQYRSEAVTNTYTETYYPDETIYTRQKIVNLPELYRVNANGSLDYDMDAAGTVQLAAELGTREIDIDTKIDSISTDEASNYSYTNRRRDEGASKRLELNYDRSLSGEDELEAKLSANASLYLSKTEDYRQQQKIFDDVTNSDLVRANLQMDYEKELARGRKFETGIRSYLRSTDMNYNRDVIEADGTVTPIQEDHFEFNEHVHAAYGQWNGEKGKYNLSFGLRAELSFTEGVQKLIDTSFDREYLHLFPSTQISQAGKNGRKLSFNYNRTIRRPAIFQMNPFVNDMNPNNIQLGNPDLKPALTDHLELKYEGQYQSPRHTGTDEDLRTHEWSVALLYKYRTDQIYRAALASPETEGVIENSYHNMNPGYDAGFELLYSVDLMDGWQLDIVPRYTWIYRDGTNIDADIESTTDLWQVRATADIELWKNARLTIDTIYISGYDSPQGNREAIGRTSFRLQQRLLDGKLTLTAALKDPFRQSRLHTHIRQPDFITDREFDPEANVFELTIRYDFGKIKMAPARTTDGIELLGPGDS